jgi:hypothetical protein
MKPPKSIVPVPDAEAHAGSTRVGKLAAIYAIAGGTISFAGWAFDHSRLTDWDGNGISIQPNATVGVVLAGVSVLAHPTSKTASCPHRRRQCFHAGFLSLLEWVGRTPRNVWPIQNSE